SSAGSLAGAKPAVERARSLADRLGPAWPNRALAHHRRLRGRLHRCRRRPHRAGDRAPQDHAARHLRGWRLHDVLCRAAADVKDKAAHHGFLNIWTRSLDPEDIDKLVDTYGLLPGEFMS